MIKIEAGVLTEKEQNTMKTVFGEENGGFYAQVTYLLILILGELRNN